MKEQSVKFEGLVVGVVRNGAMVRLDNGHRLRAILSGRLMKRSIRVIVGDRVAVEVTPYDITKARITRRYSSATPA